MNNADIRMWYEFSLQQIAAESYLDLYMAGEEQLEVAIQRGNTNWRPGSDGSNLYTKMTSVQATDFVEKNQIVAHKANTASGFSATLMLNTATNEYTLSFRSTEYKNQNQRNYRGQSHLPIRTHLDPARTGSVAREKSALARRRCARLKPVIT